MGKSIDETEADLCRALWLSVFMQQLIDATGKAKTKRAERNRLEALAWFSSKDDINNGFAEVCYLAGIDPVKTRKIVEGILSGKREKVDFRCTKKTLCKNRCKEGRQSYLSRSRRNAERRKAAKQAA